MGYFILTQRVSCSAFEILKCLRYSVCLLRLFNEWHCIIINVIAEMSFFHFCFDNHFSQFFCCFQSLPVAAVRLTVRTMKKDQSSAMSSNKTLLWRVLHLATQCITVFPKNSW